MAISFACTFSLLEWLELLLKVDKSRYLRDVLTEDSTHRVEYRLVLGWTW